MPSSNWHYTKAEGYLTDAATGRDRLDSWEVSATPPSQETIAAVKDEIDRNLRFALVHATLATVK